MRTVGSNEVGAERKTKKCLHFAFSEATPRDVAFALVKASIPHPQPRRIKKAPQESLFYSSLTHRDVAFAPAKASIPHRPAIDFLSLL